ncbi:MAG: ABC transporter ATP-binding protein [Bryobacteraceae bacterium]|jgi:ABC-type polysaccharide/polyol phosphate transport system ATPase subunit
MRLIHCDGVSKKFQRHTGQRLLRDHLTSWWKRRETIDFYALKNVSFEIESGESVAIVGSNGAGKSTLLSLICGLARPNEGTIEVNGRIAALLELGSGFHPDLTGAENLRLNAALLGFSKRETLALFDSIVDFAGLADVIDEPLRTYSSGMVMRLAFSVAVNIDPDILIIDEILAVGDQAFQLKCMERIRRFRAAQKTLLFVSHSPTAVLQFCDRALWLDHGELIMQGEADNVLAAYQGKGTVSQNV